MNIYIYVRLARRNNLRGHCPVRHRRKYLLIFWRTSVACYGTRCIVADHYDTIWQQSQNVEVFTEQLVCVRPHTQKNTPATNFSHIQQKAHNRRNIETNLNRIINYSKYEATSVMLGLVVVTGRSEWCREWTRASWCSLLSYIHYSPRNESSHGLPHKPMLNLHLKLTWFDSRNIDTDAFIQKV